MGIPSLLTQDWRAIDVLSWGGLFYSAFLSIGLAYLLWYRSVGKLGGSRTAIYSNVTPVVALAAGAIWLGEQLSVTGWVGGALIVGAALWTMARRGDARH